MYIYRPNVGCHSIQSNKYIVFNSGIHTNRSNCYKLAGPLPGVVGKKLGCPLGWAIC